EIDENKRDRRRGSAVHRLGKERVEAATVEEPGQLIAAAQLAQLLSRPRVLDRDRGGVGEPLRKLEVELGEARALAFAVPAHRADDDAARDERHGDDRLGLADWRARDVTGARVEVRLVARDRT